VLQITNNDPPVGRQATRVPAIMPAIVEIAKAADTPDEIAARIRTAHQNVVTSFRNAIKYALQAGEALSAAKADKAVPHGQWGDFLRKCDIGDRTARRYMQLAELAKRSPTTVLDGISIEAAIKKLLSPKDGTAPSPKAKPRPYVSIAKTETTTPRPPTHLRFLEIWMATAPADRKRVADSIGADAWLDAIPDSWFGVLERRLAERRRPALRPEMPVGVIPKDLSIPEFLKRTADDRQSTGAA
jgi:hypothetical protein